MSFKMRRGPMELERRMIRRSLRMQARYVCGFCGSPAPLNFRHPADQALRCTCPDGQRTSYFIPEYEYRQEQLQVRPEHLGRGDAELVLAAFGGAQ